MECLRCKSKMRSLGSEKLQLGKSSVIFGVWGNILEGALEVAIFQCGKCGKLEFYSVVDDFDGDRIAQVECQNCGKVHDLDDSKCPYCGERVD